MIKILKTLREKTGSQVRILLVEWNAEQWIWKRIVFPTQSLSTVAYYKISQMIGYDRVPESLFCPEELETEHGTLQKYIEGVQSSAAQPAAGFVSAEELQNLAAFDFMTNMFDRNLNVIVENEKLWPIDNESMYWLPICTSEIKHLIGQPLLESTQVMAGRAIGVHAAVVAMIKDMRYPWEDTTEQQKELLGKISYYVGGRISLLGSIARDYVK